MKLICLNKKKPKMSPLLQATSSLQKNYNEPSKVAQLAKMVQSGHPISLTIGFNYRARSYAQIIFPAGFGVLNKDPTVWLDGAIVGEIKYRMIKIGESAGHGNKDLR
jgi:hypothetical protein